MITVMKSSFFRIFRHPFIAAALLILPFLLPFTDMLMTHESIRRGSMMSFGTIDPTVNYDVIIYLIAIFTLLLIDPDKKNGGIRNKITSGTPRHMIYLGNLAVTCIYAVIASGMLFLSWKLFFIFTGDAGRKEYSVPETTSCMVILLWDLAFACLFVLIEYYFSKRIFSAFLCLILLIGINCCGLYAENRLYEPYKLTKTDEVTGEEYKELNPKYVKGTKRKVFTYIDRNVPEKGISSKIRKNTFKEQTETTLGLIIISTAAGVISFKRKDLE